MKVVLKEDVPNLGRMGDTVNISDGYGRNFLFPKKLAIPATKASLKMVEHEIKIINGRKEKIVNTWAELKNKIEKTPVNLSVKVGEYDKIFGSITSMDIAQQLKKLGFDIDRKNIALADPIKDLGMHMVKIKLYPGVTAESKVNVVPEETAS